MGITWCRERLEQAQNSKNPVDRILIRCSNAMKPKTYSRSQDRLADDILYRGIRKDNLQMAPPRSRTRPRDLSDWQTCALTVPDEPSAAPVPPPRKKRKRKLNGDVPAAGSQELLSQESADTAENKENVHESNDAGETSLEAICNGEKPPTSSEQRGQNRFIKLSENKGAGKIKTDFHANGPPFGARGDREEKQRAGDGRRREQKTKVVKNVSTVSLPNYNDLVKPTGKNGADAALNSDGTETAPGRKPPPPRRNQSTISLPGEGCKPILSSLSEATIHRLETYMKRCRSFGSLKPQQLLEKLEEFNKSNRSESESSDSWSGLDDWDLGVIEYCDPETANAPPVTPKSTLPPKTKKMFSIGSPQGTRPPSPVSEMEEPQSEARTGEDPVDNSENVPSNWFSESQTMDKLVVDKIQVKTPPPSPANGAAEEETLIENEPSQSSLIEILTKYKDEEMREADSVRRESNGEETSTKDVEVEEETQEKKPPKKLTRNRSRSLIETNPHLLQLERFARRSPSIGFERTTSFLNELSRNSDEIEKEFLEHPEKILNGLRRASMYENLPEDPFEVYLSRKKPSLRESLSVFLGFKPEKSVEKEKSEGDEKPPPPLPLSPPPIVTNLPEPTDQGCPLVTVTTEEEQPKNWKSFSDTDENSGSVTTEQQTCN